MGAALVKSAVLSYNSDLGRSGDSNHKTCHQLHERNILNSRQHSCSRFIPTTFGYSLSQKEFVLRVMQSTWTRRDISRNIAANSLHIRFRSGSTNLDQVIQHTEDVGDPLMTHSLNFLRKCSDLGRDSWTQRKLTSVCAYNLSQCQVT